MDNQQRPNRRKEQHQQDENNSSGEGEDPYNDETVKSAPYKSPSKQSISQRYLVQQDGNNIEDDEVDPYQSQF